MLRSGCNVFGRYGNVWCPWEVGPSKDGRAGSNPVTSDLSPQMRHFFWSSVAMNSRTIEIILITF